MINIYDEFTEREKYLVLEDSQLQTLDKGQSDREKRYTPDGNSLFAKTSGVKNKVNMYKNLTEHEIDALNTTCNLADAHTHQSQTDSQRRIVARLPEIWHEAEQHPQAFFEEKFICLFFSTQNQKSAIPLKRTMLSYAASISIMAVSAYLREQQLSVSLLEPCFDNLPALLRQYGVETHALHESYLEGDLYKQLNQQVKTDAVFLLDPNNPTGFSLMKDRSHFDELIRFCKDQRKLLILDLCFAPFAQADKAMGRFDVYEVLEEANIPYFVIEDTGKTFPVQDAKCSLLTASHHLFQQMRDIQTDILLNVSPFILNMLCEYLIDARENSFDFVSSLIENNTTYLKQKLDQTILEYQEPDCKVSVAWIKINHEIKGNDLQKILLKHKIYVLPGSYFFWSTGHDVGDEYIRIALSRSPDKFKESIDLLTEVIKTL